MKAIMISIRPQFVAKILNGEKKEECRNTYPKDFEGWVYIYCTKNENQFAWKNAKLKLGLLNGKVVARFYLKKVRKYTENDTIRSETIKDTCLTSQEIWQYAKGKPVYLWHIDNLEIFDDPKELCEFKKITTEKQFNNLSWLKDNEVFVVRSLKPLTKAPQSWGYIEI